MFYCILNSVVADNRGIICTFCIASSAVAWVFPKTVKGKPKVKSLV